MSIFQVCISLSTSIGVAPLLIIGKIHEIIVNAGKITSSPSPTPAAIKDALIRQLYCPVRWTETVQKFANDGIVTSYEFGPGKVLSGLAKRIDKSVSCASVNDVASFEKALTV